MKHIMLAVVLGLLASPAFAGTCVVLGSIVECGGTGMESSTVVPLGPNTGVIITDQATTPYTIIRPGQARAFDPTPLPNRSNFSTLNSPTSPSMPMPGMILPPDPGLGNGLGAFGGGLLGE